MILVVSLAGSENSLHDLEFVRPVERLVRSTGVEVVVKHHTQLDESIRECNAIILCGTALGDEEVLQYPERFHFLRDFPGPIFCIGTGANLLSLVYSGETEACVEMGMVELEGRDDIMGDLNIGVFSLHTRAPVPSEEFTVVARSNCCVHVFRSLERPVYGVLFHPEARNPELLVTFIRRTCL